MGTERFITHKHDSVDHVEQRLGRFTFPKSNRIRKRVEFTGLSRRSRKVQNRHFILLYAEGSENHSRVGITVSKRVGNAVTRNRIKRYCREFFRHHRRGLPGVHDFNIIARKHAAALNGKTTIRSLNQLFSKI